MTNKKKGRNPRDGGTRLTVSLSPSESAIIAAAAERDGLQPAHWLRMAIRAARAES